MFILLSSYPLILLFRLEQKFVDGTLDMELALKAFQRLKDEFQKEFREFELQVPCFFKTFVNNFPYPANHCSIYDSFGLYFVLLEDLEFSSKSDHNCHR